LGLAIESRDHPGRATGTPLWATVSDDEGSVAGVAAMTRPESLLLVVDSRVLDAACAQIAEHIFLEGREIRHLLAVTPCAEAFIRAWKDLADWGVKERRGLLGYGLRDVAHFGDAPGRLRPAAQADAGLMTEWFCRFCDAVGEAAEPDKARDRTHDRIAQGGLYIWEDEEPVSMAAAIRPTRRGVAIGGVYTPPEHRSKGYASACVSRLSQNLLDAGRAFCMLFADAENPVSNAVYRRIGYKPIADFLRVAFERPE